MTRRHLPVLPPDARLLDRRAALLASGGALLLACSGPQGNDDGPPADAVSTDGPGADAPVDGVSGDATPACGGRDYGTVDMFPVGTRAALGGGGFMLARDERGLWAVELICPHFGGTVILRTVNNEFQLYCTMLPTADHGSYYNADGEKENGPEPPPGRPRNLRNFAVGVCDGHVFVNRASEVPIGTRVPAV